MCSSESHVFIDSFKWFILEFYYIFRSNLCINEVDSGGKYPLTFNLSNLYLTDRNYYRRLNTGKNRDDI